MAWGRFGFGSPDDDQPIEVWMDDQNNQVAQRDAMDAAGRERWDDSTRSGENLDASRPTDVAALGSASASPNVPLVEDSDRDAPAGSPAPDNSDGAPNPPLTQPSRPSVRYVRAQPGDNITRLVGSSEDDAIGAFARLNGMDGRNSTIYAGRVYAIPTDDSGASPEDAALGNQLLRHDNAKIAALRAQRTANDQFQALFDAGENVWTAQPVTAGPTAIRPPSERVPASPSETHWYDNPLVKVPAAAAAFGGGLLFGSIVRGPVRTGQFIGDTLDFGARLLDPHDAENHPLNSARDQVNEFGRGVADLAHWAASNPATAARLATHEFRNTFDPTSIPIAPTTSDEVRNQLEIGATDGEFLTPGEAVQRARGIVEALQGGEEAVKAARYAATVKPSEYARLIERGDPPAMAEHLSDPYPEDAMGSHFIARSATFPDKVFGIPLPEGIAGQPLPRSYIDSPLNVNKFEGMSRDQAYTGHYGYGAGFYGARLPVDVNSGKGWSGRRLNLPRYGPVERLVKGAPPPLKKAITGAAAIGGLTAYDVFGGDRPE